LGIGAAGNEGNTGSNRNLQSVIVPNIVVECI
jgi:alpha-tubulin suppressor-like RCC1 family protein